MPIKRQYVIAIDPGKMTGVAILNYTDLNEVQQHATYEIEEGQLGKFLENIFEATDFNEISFEVAIEDFKITQQTGRNSDAPWSLKYIGVVEYLCEKYSIHLTFQTPSRAKNFVPNDRLKALSFWHKGGGGHALDALRHAVLYLVEKKNWRPHNLLVDG